MKQHTCMHVLELENRTEPAAVALSITATYRDIRDGYHMMLPMQVVGKACMK